MITDITRQVAGEKAEVNGIMKEGVDPHLYKPTREDVASLMRADLVLYCGLKLEGKMEDVLEKIGSTGKPVFAVTDGIDPTYLLEPEGSAGHPDPHVWMDARGWMAAVQAVASSLSQFDPPGADVYASRAESYLSGLEELDTYVRGVISTIPERQRVLLTAHDAFNYFGRAYGIEVRGIQGLSTESEAGVRDINDLVTMMVERDIAAVFVETSVADKNVRALVEGARSRGHTVEVGGELFSDAMGAPGTYHGTYIGMIDHNATTISRALGGNAPEGGFRLWKKDRTK